MQFNEIFEKTKYAFEHDEVFELLNGHKDYAYQAPQFPFSVPTCDEYIFREGVFPLYREADTKFQAVIIEKLKGAINRMLHSENEITVWWALSILQGQKDYECYFKTSPFVITTGFWNEIKYALAKNKNKLQSSQHFLGGNHSNGLWGEVERINRLLIADYGVAVLEGDANE